MTNLSNSELGDLGESKLKTLAQQARMTPSPPDKDRKGWDFFLEWEIDSAKPRAPLDRDHREVKALVQVKTSMGHPGNWSVKLTNWKSLVEYGGPSFFVALEMEDDETGLEVANLYVVHVGEDLISRYLKRLRELENETTASDGSGTSDENTATSKDSSGASEKPPALHNHTMTVSFEGHVLRAPTPACLRKALETPLSAGPQDYIDRKRRLIREAGYGDEGMARIKGRIDLQAPDKYRGKSPHQFLADMILGETGPVELTGGELTDFRFGIPSKPRPLPLGKIELKGTRQPVKLRFERRTGIAKRKRFETQMLDGRTENDEGDFLGKVRFELPLGDITITTGEDFLQTNFAFQAPAEDPVALTHYRDYLDFFLFLREAVLNDEQVEVHLKADDGGNWNRFCLLNTGGDGQLEQMKETDAEEMKTMLKVTRQALKAASEADLPRNIEATPQSLFAQRGELAFFEGLCLGESKAASDAAAFFYFDRRLEESEHASIVGSDVALIGDFIFILGKYYLLLSYATRGKLTFARSEEVPDRERDTAGEEPAPGSIGDTLHYYKIDLERCFGYDLYVLEEGDTMPKSSIIRLEGARHLPASYGPVFASEGEEVWIYSDAADLRQDLK